MAKNGKEYRLGKRFLLYRNIFYLFASLVVFSFYFIYDYLFAESLGILRGAPLAIILAAVDLVILYIAKLWCDRVMSGSSYKVTEYALEIQMGRNLQKLAWKDFEKAWFDMITFSTKCPVAYMVQGKKFMPNQYLDDIWTMNQEIVKHIRPYAEIEEGLEEKINAFS